MSRAMRPGCRRSLAQALRMAITVARQPCADVAAPGDGRKVVDSPEHIAAPQAFNDAERKGRACGCRRRNREPDERLGVGAGARRAMTPVRRTTSCFHAVLRSMRAIVLHNR